MLKVNHFLVIIVHIQTKYLTFTFEYVNMVLIRAFKERVGLSCVA